MLYFAAIKHREQLVLVLLVVEVRDQHLVGDHVVPLVEARVLAPDSAEPPRQEVSR